MKFNPKMKIYVLVFSVVIVFAIMVIFGILPLQNRIEKLNNNIYDQRVNYEFVSQQRQDIVHLEREIMEIETKQEKIVPAIFNRNQTLELITTLESIAQKYGLNDQDLNLSNPTMLDSGLLVSTLRIELKTSYNNLVSWIAELEQKPFYVIINSLSLSGLSSDNPNSTEDNSSISATISAKIYWL